MGSARLRRGSDDGQNLNGRGFKVRPLTKAAVSEEDLAELLAITREQLRELRRSRHLPHLRINRYTIRYLPDHVAEIVERFEIRSTVAPADSGLSPTSIARRHKRGRGAA